MNKWMKKLTAALCAAVLMCGMAVTAYAGGVSGDKSDSETQKQAQSTIPREVILVICVIAAVLILIIVWRAVLKHLRKKKVETNRKRRREVDKD